MKTALVIGGMGYIGEKLANELHSRGYMVTVVDKATHGNTKLHPGISFILADIRKLDFCKSHDIVYHLADTNDDDSVFPESYITTNIWGTYNIIKSFADSRVVFASSGAAIDAHNVFGICKKSAEHFVMLHKNSVAVRFDNIFGEDQPDMMQAVPSFCRALKDNKKAIIYGNGKTTRDWVYIHDIVDELIFIGNSGIKGITEAGYGTAISTLEMYNLLARTAKKKPNFKFAPARSWDYSHGGSKHKIREPRYGLAEGIRRTVRSYM